DSNSSFDICKLLSNIDDSSSWRMPSRVREVWQQFKGWGSSKKLGIRYADSPYSHR
ncbi:MAG: hypothetical protein ACI809_002598, partial [Candidatus Azotimanducaceae bacterium]